MDAPSQQVLSSLEAAGRSAKADVLVHWRSAFGLIIIETRGDKVFVNGDPVRPANLGEAKEKDSA